MVFLVKISQQEKFSFVHNVHFCIAQYWIFPLVVQRWFHFFVFALVQRWKSCFPSPFLNRCDFQVISSIMWRLWGLTNQDLLRVDKLLLYDITKKGSQWVAKEREREATEETRIQSDDTIEDSKIEFRKLIARQLYMRRETIQNWTTQWSIARHFPHE